MSIQITVKSKHSYPRRLNSNKPSEVGLVMDALESVGNDFANSLSEMLLHAVESAFSNTEEYGFFCADCDALIEIKSESHFLAVKSAAQSGRALCPVHYSKFMKAIKGGKPVTLRCEVCNTDFKEVIFEQSEAFGATCERCASAMS